MVGCDAGVLQRVRASFIGRGASSLKRALQHRLQRIHGQPQPMDGSSGPSASERDLPEEHVRRDVALCRESLHEVYSALPVPLVTGAMAGALLAAVQWASIDPLRILAWAGALLVVTVARAFVLAAFHMSRPIPEQQLSRWGRRALFGNALSGIVWGVAGLALFPPTQQAAQLTLAAVLAAVGAGAVTMHSAMPSAARAFLVPCLLPLALRFFWSETLLGVGMGVAVLVFLAIMLWNVRRLGRAFSRAVELRIESQRKADELGYRADFERLVNELSSVFISCMPEELDQTLRRALGRIGEFAAADRSYLFLLSSDGRRMDNTHEWCAPGVEPQMARLQGIDLDSELPWAARRFRSRQVVNIPCVADLGEEAALEKKHWQAQSIRSLVVVPLVSFGRFRGLLGFDNVNRSVRWSDDVVALLRIVADIVMGSLERRRAVLALRASEQQYLMLAEGAPVGIFRVDQAGCFCYVNDRWCTIMGVAREEALGRHWTSGIHPMDLGSARETWDRARRSGEPFQAEYRVEDGDGAPRWVYSQAIASRDGYGAASAYVGSVTDISSRKSAEVALRSIVEGTNPVTGADFFKELVRHLAASLDMRYAFVGELTGPARNRVRTLAIWAGDRFRDNIDYSLEGTPCREVVSFRPCSFPRDTSRLFPGDEMLVELGVESYLGVPLSNSAGTPIGLMCVMDPAPCGNVPMVQAVLRVFASRAAAELERKGAEDALQRSEQRVRLLLESTAEGIYGLDMEGRCVFCNPAAARMLGYEDTAPLTGRKLPEVIRIHAERDTDAEVAVTECPMCTAYGTDQSTHLASAWSWRADGSRFPMEFWSFPVRSEGRVTGTVVSFVDITERRRAEEEQRLAATAFETQEAILVSDQKGRILRVNRAFTDITGFPAAAVVGKSVSVLKTELNDEPVYAELVGAVLEDQRWEGELWSRRASGEAYTIWLTATAVGDDQGNRSHYVVTFSDISARKEAESRIQHLAYHDALTGLPNRRLLLEHLERALASCRRHGRFGALMFLDIDSFKTLNDARGHPAGDALLREVADRLTSSLREDDTVARLGGDEFIVLSPELADQIDEAARSATALAEKIREIIAIPCQVAGQDLAVTVSVGITLFPASSGDALAAGRTESRRTLADEVLRQADTAMYRAKAAGRDAVLFFEPAMQAAADGLLELHRDLRAALVEGQFRLYYQMQVDAGGSPVGAEALIRWQHPRRGLLCPVDFIPAAEETSLILAIGEWALRQACSDLRRCLDKGLPAGFRHLCVNISSRQVYQPDFVERVRMILQDSAIDPRLLTLELTESLILDDAADIRGKIAELRSMGVRFAIDDFGTGYASLQRLKQFPPDVLKIDRSFVDNLVSDKTDVAIVDAILSLAARLNTEVIAEGVETRQQFEILLARGCPVYQGYHFGQPGAFDSFERRLSGDVERI